MLHRFALIIFVIVLVGGLAHAQQPTLREMATASGIRIGAAADVWDLPSRSGFEDALARNFNSLTIENHLKMCFVQEKEGEFNFTDADTMVELAEKHNMEVRGHTLIWYTCVPEWLENRTLTRNEAIEIMRMHITTVMQHYKGRIQTWDVVNEPFEPDGRLRKNIWQQAIGDDYIALAFQFAHEADPTARLILNEFDTETINAKSNAVYQLARDLRLSGVPIDGIGMQMHIALGEVVEGGIIDPVSFENNIRRLGQLGLKVEITEMDVAHQGVPTEDRMRQLAGHYYQIFAICIKWKAFCDSFTTWGVFDGETWLRSPDFYNNPEVAPLLLDDQMKPKLAYTALLDVLARDQGLAPLLTDEEVTALKESGTIKVDIAPPNRSDPDQLAPDSAHGALYYAAFPITITVDGDPSDWVNIPRDTVFEGPLIPDGNVTELTFAAAADTDNLYFLAEVIDDKLVYGNYNPSSEWYKEDSVEFYINGTGDLTLRGYTSGIVQIGIAAASIESDTLLLGGGRSTDVPVNAVVVKTDIGYRVEASIPVKTDIWTITPAHGQVIGFQVHLNGSSGSDRDTKLIWSAFDTQDQSWTDPSVFGRLMFWDTAQ
jgi:endo-1,4-beta-xylanase